MDVSIDFFEIQTCHKKLMKDLEISDTDWTSCIYVTFAKENSLGYIMPSKTASQFNSIQFNSIQSTSPLSKKSTLSSKDLYKELRGELCITGAIWCDSILCSSIAKSLLQ